MDNRSLRDILEELEKPIPRRFLKTNEHEGTQYFSVNTFKRFLKQRAPFYSCTSSTSISGNLVVVDVTITIRASDGVVTRSANGFSEHKQKMYGDCASNAFAQGFKTCCKMLGLGRVENE